MSPALPRSSVTHSLETIGNQTCRGRKHERPYAVSVTTSRLLLPPERQGRCHQVPNSSVVWVRRSMVPWIVQRVAKRMANLSVSRRLAVAEMFIEIDARCNARCFYCDTGNQSRLPHRKWMDVGVFERILDHALVTGLIDEGTLVYLFDRGEPTLHPEFSSIVRGLDRRSIEYCISTNCGMPPRLDEELSMAGLRKLVISMPGFSQGSYDRIHRLPFDKVLHNIEFMLADFQSRGSTAQAIMSFHVYRFNTDELAPAAEFCKKKGIIFAPYFAYFNDTVWSLDFLNGRLSDNVLARAKEELFLEKLSEVASQTPTNFRCPQYDRITINELGELVLCCGAPRPGNSYLDGYRLGNFLELPADEVMRLKTTSKTCKTCVACGNAYLVHSCIRPTEYMPHDVSAIATDSNIKALDGMILSRWEKQWAAVENASLILNEDGMNLVEDRSFGFHRLLGYVEEASGTDLTITVLAKATGRRSQLMLDLCDEGHQNYAGATFDMLCCAPFDMRGGFVRAEMSESANGFYRISLGIQNTPGCRLHYSIALVNRHDGVRYRGNAADSVVLKGIDVR